MQGGLEIPVQVVVTMNYSQKNKDALFKYETLVHKTTRNPWTEGLKM